MLSNDTFIYKNFSPGDDIKKFSTVFGFVRNYYNMFRKKRYAHTLVIAKLEKYRAIYLGFVNQVYMMIKKKKIGLHEDSASGSSMDMS